MSQPLLIVVVGPTAVGKTSMSIALAKHYGTEIISADSRQIYREMTIGTAKPSEEEQQAARHHLIDSHSIHEEFDAGKFAETVESLLPTLFGASEKVVMVGGSGLYVKAYCEGLDEMPDIPEEVRQELNEEYESQGLVGLLDELEKKDPDYYNQVDRNNPQRIIRALEIIRYTHRSYSELRKNQTTKPHEHHIIKVGLEMDRTQLYERIDKRMDYMIEQGLFEEAEVLYEYRQLNALQTVGYQEIFDYIDGKYDKAEAIRLLKRNSRRYAKRQMTWFKRDENVKWFHPDQVELIIRHIDQEIG